MEPWRWSRKALLTEGSILAFVASNDLGRFSLFQHFSFYTKIMWIIFACCSILRFLIGSRIECLHIEHAKLMSTELAELGEGVNGLGHIRRR